MEKALFVAGLLATAPIFSELQVFQTHQKNFLFSTVFDFDSNEGSLGSAVKSSFHLRTHYDLYTPRGEYEGTGICRLLTLGVFYSWATEIDVYDPCGCYVGFIDGQAMTGASAKFSFYDQAGERKGIAYLDRTCGMFTVVDPDNEQRYLATFKRNFILGTVDHWDVHIFDHKAIDLRILKIFAAFAVDTQEHFKRDI